MGVSSQATKPLRRGVMSWLLVHVNFLFVFIALLLLVGGLASGRLDTVLVGLGLSSLCLSPLLLGARIEDGELIYGYRWRRHHVRIADIEHVEIGRIEGYGLRGGDAMALTLTLRNGETSPIPESQFVSRKRLETWFESIREAGSNALLVER